MRSRISDRYVYPKFVGLKCGPSKAKQSFAAECDVNRIMSRYHKTGVLGNPLDTRRPYFGDFSSVPDYQASLEFVRGAERAFLALPTSLRLRFGNDVQNILAFVADPANAKEAIELGLLPKPPLYTGELQKGEPAVPAGTPGGSPKPATPA
nr:MAG: internal scaffolding protein [Microvirus sp.]